MAIIALGVPSASFAAPPVRVDASIPLVEQDPPASHAPVQRGGGETVYGGIDGSGVAVQGGIWDFEDGSLQGWRSIDLTDEGVRGRRVETPFIGAISMNSDGSTSVGSLWIGATEPEAAADCWPGGLGYGNLWTQRVSKTLSYDGTGDVTIEFDYFVDSETQFDFTYVYVEQGSMRVGPLNTSAWSNPDTGFGYSGSVLEGTAIGSPSAPAHETIVVAAADFPTGAGSYDLVFEFDSDPLFSDEEDFFGGDVSMFGPFGFDAVVVDGVNEGDFETSSDGWVFSAGDPIGAFLAVNDLDDLEPVDDPCDCPLTVAGNDFVITAFDPGGGLTHPNGQSELLLSAPAYVGGTPFNSVSTRYGVWADTPFTEGVGYRMGLHYYPWTCPTSGTVGWTTHIAGPGGFSFEQPASCETLVSDFSSFVPSAVDSVRIAINILAGCDEFGIGECFPTSRNQSPYFDDLQIVTRDLLDAPSIFLDVTFGDRFPSDNSIQPSSTVDAKSWFDVNRSDSDLTNADMGDSAVVFAGTTAGTRVFLNFRVTPGPETDTSDPFFSRYGGDFIVPGGGWAKVRMDSAEAAWGVDPGRYATYVHEFDGGVEGAADYKILADGVLTPGTTVEYFFSADFGSGFPESTQPDTTGGFYLEWEALPGFFESGSGDVLAPCTLYIDAFNAGGQAPIEAHGLEPYLGTQTDVNGVVHNGWDRWDYIASSSGVGAPFARELNGDNGMTKFQSYFYETIVINTGTFQIEGLRDGDAELLINWATNDDTSLIQKGLWLNGSGVANILDRPGRPNSRLLLSSVMSAQHVCNYGASCATSDDSDCVRLDPAPGASFGSIEPYAAARGLGCPTSLGFDVVEPLGSAVGDLLFVDQDAAGQPSEAYASVSHDQFSSAARYGAVIDGFSLHDLVAVAPDFSGGTATECGDDPTAITQRVDDVFTWMGIPMSGALCEAGGIVDAPSGPAVVPARTMLHQNSPNPFNPKTTVRYELHVDTEVTLQVFDVNGALVRTLVRGEQTADRYSVVWDGTTENGHDVSSGVFWARLSTSRGFRASTKMIVLK